MVDYRKRYIGPEKEAESLFGYDENHEWCPRECIY